LLSEADEIDKEIKSLELLLGEMVRGENEW
jgi:hypothetical protein